MNHRNVSREVVQNLVRSALGAGRTIGQLAAACEVSRQTVHNWKAGRTSASARNVTALMFLADLDEETVAEVALLREENRRLKQEVAELTAKAIGSSS